MKRTKLLLDVPYSIDKTIKVLEDNIDRPKMLTLISKKNHKCPFIGKIKGNRFIFREQSIWGYSGLYDRNNLHPYFEGHIVPTGEFCQISGKFTNGPVAGCLMPVLLTWFAFLCGISSIAIIHNWFTGADGPAPVILIFTLPVFLLSIYGLFFSNPSRKRDVEKYIETFEKLLNAKINETA
jgi:hypothetical protein